MKRRAILFALAAMLACPATMAAAETFPSRLIKIIVPLGPGGSADSLARIYAQKMSELLNTPVIIENRPGAGMMIAIRALMAAPPDGYTLMVAVGSVMVQNPALREDLPYDPLKDFTPIGIVATNAGVIFVNNDVPVRTISELVAYSAANPGKLNYGTTGVGSAGHLHMEAIMSLTGMQLTHVPYKSDIEVVREVISGNVHVAMQTTLNTTRFIKSGEIRALAVETSKRLPYLPDVPSLAEGESSLRALVGLEPHTFSSIVGPAGMPPDVVAKLSDAINTVSQMPDVAARLRDNLYAEPAVTTPQSFRTFVETEMAKWKVLGKTIKLPPL